MKYFSECDGCLSYWIALDADRKKVSGYMRWESKEKFQKAVAVKEKFEAATSTVKPFLNGPPSSDDWFIEHISK